MSSQYFDGVATQMKAFTCVSKALEHAQTLYDQALGNIDANLKNQNLQSWKGAFYPYIGMHIPEEVLEPYAQDAYGIVLEPGTYGTTLTRFSYFSQYYHQQMQALYDRYNQPMWVGQSFDAIPYPFGAEEALSHITQEHYEKIRRIPDIWPHLHRVSDDIADGKSSLWKTGPKPMTLFSGERVDYSLNRLHHYSGTLPEHFQGFILLTNYQRYIQYFLDYAKEQVHGDTNVSLVLPHNVELNKNNWSDERLHQALQHLPQMPAYHLKYPNGQGITLVNIGVGPSNAKNITDHLAVLRPHMWMMLGHCAGLRSNQRLGDYVLPHGYVRDDHVLDDVVPRWIPIPAIAEIQVAIHKATRDITGISPEETKKRLRTGTVMSTSNRNWELHVKTLLPTLNKTRAVGLDMESAALATNGFRFRVPYGALLCVSDIPLHGEIKLRGMASQFYQKRVKQHMDIGLRTVEILREQGVDTLHSRKLRGFQEPPWR